MYKPHILGIKFKQSLHGFFIDLIRFCTTFWYRQNVFCFIFYKILFNNDVQFVKTNTPYYVWTPYDILIFTATIKKRRKLNYTWTIFNLGSLAFSPYYQNYSKSTQISHICICWKWLVLYMEIVFMLSNGIENYRIMK